MSSFDDIQENSHIDDWFPDTGATHQVTPDLQNLNIFDECKGKDHLKVRNGNGLNFIILGRHLKVGLSRFQYC